MYYLIAFSLLYSLRGFTSGSGNLILYFLPDFILLIGIFRHSFVNEVKLYVRKLDKEANYYFYAGFLVLFLLSLVRSSFPGITAFDQVNDLVTFILFNFLGYSVLSRPFRKRDYFDAIFTKGTIKLISIPLIVSSLLLIVSFSGSLDSVSSYQSDIGNSAFLGLLGIEIEASPLPFSQGLRLSYVSLLAGGTLVMAWLAIRYFEIDNLKKNIFYGGMVACGILVLLADSWAPLLCLGATAGVLFYYLKFRQSKFIRIGIWALPIIPVLIMVIMGTSGVSITDKNIQSSEGTTAMNRRLIMWENSTDKLLSFSGAHIIGNGQYGNIAAGVNRAYHETIPQKNVRQVEVCHNTFFQSFFDTGIIGVVFLILAMVMGFDNAIYLYERGYVGGLIYGGFIIYASFGSMWYALAGVYNPPLMFTLMLVLMGSVVYKNEFFRMASEDWN